MVPQEEMIVIDYDGVRRVPVRLTGRVLFVPRNFRAQAPFKSDPIRRNRRALTNSAYPMSPR